MIWAAVAHFVVGALWAALGVCGWMLFLLFNGMADISDVSLPRTSAWLPLAATLPVAAGLVWQGVRLLRMRHGPPGAWKQPSFLVVEAILSLALLAVVALCVVTVAGSEFR